MSKHLLSALALSLSLGALPLASTASATETYLSVYQAGVPNIPSVYTGQTTSQLQTTFNNVTGGNIQLFDVESYYDAAGVLRHDSTYNFHPSESGASNIFVAPVEIVLDEDLPSFLVTYQAMLNAGKRLQDMNVLEEITSAKSNKYGSGLARTNGVPSISLSEKPFLGANVALELGSVWEVIPPRRDTGIAACQDRGAGRAAKAWLFHAMGGEDPPD